MLERRGKYGKYGSFLGFRKVKNRDWIDSVFLGGDFWGGLRLRLQRVAVEFFSTAFAGTITNKNKNGPAGEEDDF